MTKTKKQSADNETAGGYAAYTAVSNFILNEVVSAETNSLHRELSARIGQLKSVYQDAVDARNEVKFAAVNRGVGVNDHGVIRETVDRQGNLIKSDRMKTLEKAAAKQRKEEIKALAINEKGTEARRKFEESMNSTAMLIREHEKYLNYLRDALGEPVIITAEYLLNLSEADRERFMAVISGGKKATFGNGLESRDIRLVRILMKYKERFELV